MPTLQEMIDLLERQAEEARDRISELMHDDELPGRVVFSVVESVNGLIDSITGHGTLLPSVPHIPLPSSHSAIIVRRSAPAPPPSFWQRATRHVKGHVYIYSVLAGSTLTIVATSLAAHWSPAFRARLFGQLPFLRPVYLTATARLRKKPLPPVARPRLTANGKGRLEAVLVLGADKGTQGREVVKRFEKKGFIVIASVSQDAGADELERVGNGFVKAIYLDPFSGELDIGPFNRALNTALSLRYPLNSPGDPFASPDTALQLVAVINCLPLSCPNTPSSGLPLPIEAVPAELFASSLGGVQTTSLAVLQKVLPMFRTPKASARRDIPAPGIVVTCFPAAQRYLGTPFSGQQGALLGLAANGFAGALDVLRRELALSARDAGVQPIKVVNVDVGFLKTAEHSHGKPHRLHRGNDVGPRDVPAPSAEAEKTALSAEQAQAALPRHLRETYASSLLASTGNDEQGKRKHMPPHHALADRLLHIVLAKKASHIADRISVGAGVKTYYLASLLPTSFIDTFFSFRHRLLMRSASSPATSRPAVLPRKPLPLPGEASPDLPSSSKFSSEKASSASDTDSSGADRPLPHESDTILPQYAPSTRGSSIAPDSGMPSPTGVESASSAFSSGYASEATRAGDDEDDHAESSEGSTPSRSTVLGESYVQV